MPSALLSVSDKSGLASFARRLAALGFDLVSTGGTARAIEAEGLSVRQVADVTGFPEMLDGRVKTLHPRVHGGILARRARQDDLDALAAHGIGLIDLVVVNLYPFAAAAANPATSFDALIEEIDIGGPSMVRAAAKNFRDVLVVVDPSDYDRVAEALEADGPPSLALRFDLARKAIAHTAAYDRTITDALAGVVVDGDQASRTPAADRPLFAPTATIDLSLVRTLRYGENPHLAAAWYADATSTGFGAATLHQGKELSFTNLLDLDAAARIVLEFDEPAASVIKHTNPCGVATGADASAAYAQARDADPVSAFGGIIGINRTLDAAVAAAITSTFVEAVVAPAVTDDALAVLARKANLRVLTTDFGALASHAGVEWRSILGAMLAQQRDRVDEARARWTDASGDLRVVTERQPTPDEWQALRFAWRVCAHVKSNTILFANASRTLGIGAGQMSRVDAVKVATMKAGEGTLRGSVVASDAFFPFRDGLDAVAAAGATAVVQPGGSMRDKEVIDAANEHGLAMVFTGRRHFRH